MKRLLPVILMILSTLIAYGAEFDDMFSDCTLRLDIRVAGRGSGSIVTIDSISQWPGWYGRRVNLNKRLYPENMEIIVLDGATGDTIYIDTKSPNVLADDVRTAPALVQVFMPKPKSGCKVVANVYDYDPNLGRTCQSVCRKLSVDDLSAIRLNNVATLTPYRELRKSKDPERCINLAIVAEGFQPAESALFYRRASQLDSALFSQPGFKDKADRFNVVAVMLPSQESGASIPSEGVVVNSALRSHFDSFGLDRLLTLPDTKALWDALEGIPASQILILANSQKYGGSGAYNEYAIAVSEIPQFEEVLIHEFGHSFAWLGDEYESGYVDQYFPDIEPMEPNITTLHDFSGKWQNLIDKGEASLIEGGGYQEKGVWRGCEHCLMRAIEDAVFCPVCAQAITRIIDFYTDESQCD